MKFFGGRKSPKSTDETLDAYSPMSAATPAEEPAAPPKQQQRGRSRTSRPKNPQVDRYDLNTKTSEPSRNNASTAKGSEPSRYDSGFNRYSAGSPTMIDRVPTAMGYQSEDSEEEDPIEKPSRYSRYQVVPKRSKSKRSKASKDVVEEEDPDDKYNQYGGTVERLWSQSTDSMPAQWRSWSNDEHDRVGPDDEMEPAMDGKEASIVESPTKKKPKKKKEKSPKETGSKVDVSVGDKSLSSNSKKSKKEEKSSVQQTTLEIEPVDMLPAVLSDTSSLTEPVYRQKQKAEKKKKSTSSKSGKKTAAKSEKKLSPKVVAATTVAAAAVVATTAAVLTKDKSTPPNPSEELLAKESKVKTPNSKAASRKSKGGKSKKKKKAKESAKLAKEKSDTKSIVEDLRTSMSEKEKMGMYNKSLMSDDTEEHTDFDDGLVLAPPEPPPPLESYMERMKAKRKLTPAQKARKSNVTELDEYSQSSDPKVSNDPQLVQCLKFYYCGFMAAAVEVGINTATCKNTAGDAPLDEIEAMRMIDDDGHPLSPAGPKVEIMLDGFRLDGTEERDDGLLEHAALDDAPDIALPHARSYIKEVTSFHLKLDEEDVFEEDDEIDPLLEGRRAEAAGKDVVSITTIEIPEFDDTSSSDSSSKETEKPSSIDIGPRSPSPTEESSSMSLSKPVDSKKKKKRFGGMFSRFRKGKGVISAPTLPTTNEETSTAYGEEASEAPIELVAAE